MKKILITGENSFVGKSLKKWLRNFPDQYSIESISLRNDSWKEKSFLGYDVVFHAAGIAHIKEKKENTHLYYNVNRDLTFEVAKKAKVEGVKQFIFLSSMSVYGVENGIIDRDTPTKPKNNYGKSKLQAEELISTLEDSSFKVAILRPPMIYGKGCKGNYTRLASLALRTPFFPNVKNKRSMLYIDNLSEFIKHLIDNRSEGFFFPQNLDYVNTSEMVKLIVEAHGKRVFLTKLFNPALRLLKGNTVNKVFGELIYDMRMSEYKEDYRVCGFRESVQKTELRK